MIDIEFHLPDQGGNDTTSASGLLVTAYIVIAILLGVILLTWCRQARTTPPARRSSSALCRRKAAWRMTAQAADLYPRCAPGRLYDRVPAPGARAVRAELERMKKRMKE